MRKPLFISGLFALVYYVMNLLALHPSVIFIPSMKGFVLMVFVFPLLGIYFTWIVFAWYKEKYKRWFLYAMAYSLLFILAGGMSSLLITGMWASV